jgi:hypothetical protein
MRRRVLILLTLALGLALAAGYCPAADEDKTGTEPGNLLPGPFHPYNVTGERKGKLHCLVCEYGLKPVVLIFTREAPTAEGPVTKLAQALDEAIATDQTNTLRSFVVYVTDDKDVAELEKTLGEWAGAAKLKSVAVAFDNDPDDLKAYDLDKDAAVTVLVYEKLRMVKQFPSGKEKLGENDIKAIVAAAKGLVEKKK